MALKDKIKKDQVEAQKTRDEVKLGTLRLLLSDIHNREIDKGEELSEEEVAKVVKQQVKKRQEAMELYEKGGRGELVEKEKKEMEVLKAYAPEEMSDEELVKVVREVVEGMKGEDEVQFGSVMKQVMGKVAGKADGKRVAEVVKNSLS